MSCTVSPVTKTSVGDLQRIRGSLNGAYNGLKSRSTVSGNMRRSAALNQPAIHRGTKLTLPLVLESPAEKLEAAGNTLLYTLKDAQPFKLTSHLPLEYASITGTMDTIIVYSTVQTEDGKSARYAVVIIVKAKELATPLGTDPARPDSIPLCPVDADFNKSILPTAVGAIVGVSSDTAKTITFSFFKSTEGGEFKPHTVTKYGWKIPSGTDQEKLLLGYAPNPLESMSYPVNESRPYGNFFRKCRPPGFKTEWGRVATKEYSLALMQHEAPQAVEICAAAKGLVNYDNLKSALVNGSLVTLRHESGGLLYLPVNLFEIRPQQGSRVADVNVVDTGPFPRKTPRGKKISAGYRPKGTKYYSAGGNYQYVQGPWETYATRYAAMFNVTTGFKWLWEAPPQAQVWYQMAYLTENFYNYTRDVGDIFPPFYYAIMVHANNIGNSMARKFLRAAARDIATDRANNVGYNVTAAHITCKRVYEEKSWLIMKHNAYMNRILEALKRELPLIDPNLYPNNPALYPRST